MSGPYPSALALFLFPPGEMQRLGLDADRSGVVDQRLLAAVRHPDLRRTHLFQRPRELAPVGMVRDDQRQFGAALARTRAHTHPSRRHRRDRIEEASRPAIGEGRGWTEDDRALEGFQYRFGNRGNVAEVDAMVTVELA